MLEPTARHLFTDGLRPPTGFSVDLAVGTTYSLALASLLLPPLAMAAHDRERAESDDTGDDDSGGSIALLEAVRRFADRMTVFCQAGAIHVPGQYRRILTFAEDSLVEARARTENHIFHPKVWMLRFTDGEQHRHRLLCLSRNLTADTSWDTMVQLDETDVDRRSIDAEAAADFLEALPALAARPLASARTQQLAELAESLRGVRFAVPEPFTRGQLWPLGVGTQHGWPVPHAAWNAVVISPFLDRATVEAVKPGGRRVFVSRPETYTDLGGDPFAEADVRVLDPLAETALEEDEPDDTSTWEVRSGLHAKTLVWDHDGSGWCLTGSANATSAAFRGNVEFSVLLRGPVARCGVDTFLPTDPAKGELTLARVLAPHTIKNSEPRPDPTRAAELEVAAYHAGLVAAGPLLRVTPGEHDERYDVQLTFSDPLPTSPGRTTVRLLSKAGDQHAHPIEEEPVWSDLGLTGLTPFVAVSTTVPVEGTGEPLRVGCVVKADLMAAPEDRPARLLRSLLHSEENVLRYLSFLLDEGGADAWGLGLGRDAEREGGTALSRPTFDDLALLETLVRAAARGDESLTRVHALLRDLREDDGSTTVVSEEFLAVWEAVWAAASRDGGTQ